MIDVIPLLGLLKELSEVILTDNSTPNVHDTMFEDNKGYIDLVKAPKMRSKTKHIALKHYTFRSYIKQQMIFIHYVETTMQIVDFLQKH